MAAPKLLLVGTRLPVQLYRQLKILAVQRGETVQALLAAAVKQYLESA
jgi:hypothetical protein